jgi:hypothetical protein
MNNQIQGGYVLLARAIRFSSLMKMKGNDVKLAIYLLAGAAYQDIKWYDEHQHKEIIIRRGETIGTLREWASGASMTFRSVRTSLKRLAEHGFIEDITPESVKRAHGYTHLRIRKFEKYQDFMNYVGAKTTHDRHSPDTRPTHDRHTSLNEDNSREGNITKSTVDKIVKLWNKTCTNLPRVASIGRQRRENILARIKEHPDLESWQLVFEWLNRSPHHTGKNDRNWKATVDFVVGRGKGSKFQEILEKAIHERDNQQPNEPDSTADSDDPRLQLDEAHWLQE